MNIWRIWSSTYLWSWWWLSIWKSTTLRAMNQFSNSSTWFSGLRFVDDQGAKWKWKNYNFAVGCIKIYNLQVQEMIKFETSKFEHVMECGWRQTERLHIQTWINQSTSQFRFFQFIFTLKKKFNLLNYWLLVANINNIVWWRWLVKIVTIQNLQGRLIEPHMLTGLLRPARGFDHYN